jgi:hypothetical protein
VGATVAAMAGAPADTDAPTSGGPGREAVERVARVRAAFG